MNVHHVFICLGTSFIVALGGIGSYSSSVYLDTVEIFSSITQTWTALPSMMTARSERPAVCAVNKTKLIACGGYDGTNDLNSCETLDLTDQAVGWRLIANMSTPRACTSGTLLPDNKTFLMIGGGSYGTSAAKLSACEKFNTGSNTWSGAARLAVIRSFHTSALVNSKVVVMGGRDSQGSALNTCEQYDPTLNKWTVFPSFSTARSTLSSAVVLNKIYIAGDAGGGSSVEVFDGTLWSRLAWSLAKTRSDCAAVAFQNKFVVLGGDYDSPATIELFDPVTWLATSFVPAMKITPRRNLHAAVAF